MPHYQPMHQIVTLLAGDSFWEFYLSMLNNIRAESVEKLGDSFIERGNKILPQDYIDFLKETTLSEMAFEDVTDGQTTLFKIVNTQSKKSISIDNRSSSKGEIRGQNLRNILTQLAQSNPNSTLYDALNSHLRAVEHSDLHKYFIGAYPNIDVATKTILMKCSKIALDELQKNKTLTEEDLKKIYNQQHQLYIQNSPAILKPLFMQIQTTGNMLWKILNEIIKKKNATLPENKDEIDRLNAEIESISQAIIQTYKLMPAYYPGNRIFFPENYSELVQQYSQTANVIANNPNYKEFSNSAYIGFTMVALCVIALATLAAVLTFPPSALFLSQVALHGALSVGAIEGVLAGTGLAAAGAGAGFFASGTKISPEDRMQKLTDESIHAESKSKAPKGG
ncbi:MAG: hypothetical protein K2X50_09685 [Gammaproteobacteria bacterium]|nr:hypothetical protein [Gammaproteobacteria bacterium]